MSEKRSKKQRKEAKLKPLGPKERFRYKLMGFKRHDTGGGKSVKTGGRLEVTGPKSLYKEIKERDKQRKRRTD